MKKLLFLALTVSALSVGAATQKVESFINGANVLVGSNSVVLYGSTNVLYTAPSQMILYSLTNNTLAGVTNANPSAGAFQDIGVSADSLGNVCLNAAFTFSVGNTNLLPYVVTNALGQFIVSNTPWQSPIMIPASTNYYPLIPPGAITNVYSLVFAKSIDGTNYDTSSGSTFLWVITQNTTAQNSPQVYSTNVPSFLLTGARSLRLVTITNAPAASAVTSTNNGQIFNRIGMGYWVP